MNWFVVHDLVSYSQHNDLIGCKIKNNEFKKAVYGKFEEISIGDKIVYYVRGNSFVVGIFEVISNLKYISDSEWGDVVVYRIKPHQLPVEGTFLNFKQLYHQPNTVFDFIPKLKRWGIYLLGKICLQISYNDLQIISEALTNPNLLEFEEFISVKTSKWHSK